MSPRDQAAVAEAVGIATSVAEGRACLLRACRGIVRLRHRLGSVPQEILDPIVAVESELDDVPDEEDASQWESAAFQRKLRERDEYLVRVRPLLLRCFHELREYLESGTRTDI